MSVRIAVAEDDARLRTTVVGGLSEEGFEVPISVGSGAELLHRLKTTPVDVLVLDIGLPDCDGRDLCLALRAAGTDAPVLFLTAREAVADRLLGFHAGADDYLPKPFSFAEFVVRLNALGRRHVRSASTSAGLELDPGRHGARVGQRSIALTPTEFRVLSVLLSRRGDVVRRRSVVAAAWPDGSIVHDNTLDSYVARLRRKLRLLGPDADAEVVTVRGVGYRIS